MTPSPPTLNSRIAKAIEAEANGRDHAARSYAEKRPDIANDLRSTAEALRTAARIARSTK